MTTSTLPRSGDSRAEVQSIPVFRPLLREEELRASTAALEMGWLGMGSYVGDFEEALHRVVEVDNGHVVAVSTGHAALHLGLLLAGVGPGDEVITPSFNNIADFQAILATGASPVFCDVDERTLCIDTGKASELISDRTRVIIATDYACMLCDHDAIQSLAETHGVRVIHDAAHSIGSRYKGRPIGSFSDTCMFSFDPIKTITCIDGGALVVRTDEERDRLQEMRLIGMGQAPAVMYQNQRAWTYDVKRLGFRYHLANLHAAIGIEQLRRLPEMTRSRRATCLFYNDRLANLPGVSVPQTDFADVTPFSYFLRVHDGRRDELRAFLTERGVDTGVHWQPGHWFTLLEKYPRGDLGVTEQIGREVVTIPLHSMMADEDQQRVVEGIAEFFERS